jgi:hypothetical protein
LDAEAGVFASSCSSSSEEEISTSSPSSVRKKRGRAEEAVAAEILDADLGADLVEDLAAEEAEDADDLAGVRAAEAEGVDLRGLPRGRLAGGD